MSKKIMRIAQDGMLYVNRLNEGDSFSISPNFVEIGGELIEGYPFVKPVIDDSLVLWLDGSTGNNYEKTNIWKDLSGNGNDGQLMNFDFTEDSGWVDGGIRFNGVNDYVQLPDLNLNPDNFTIQVDDKIRAFNDDKVITENGDEWGRNLLRNSNFNSGSEYWDGSFIITDEGALLESVAGRADYIQNITLIPEGEYVVQIRYRVVEGQAPYLYVTNGTDMTLPQGSYIFEIGDNEWQTVTFPVIVNSESRFYAIRYAAGTPVDHLEGKTLIEWIKLEKGTQAAPWTPAPEDITETNIINHNTPFVKNNTIHSLKLYNRALTDEEILQNYQAGQCSPLLAMRGDVIG